MGGSAFTAPVYGQLGGAGEDLFGPPAPQPQQWEDVLGPAEPHNMAAWLREIAAGRNPTWSPSAAELQDFTRTANQQALAEAVNARASAQRRMADLGTRTGLRDEQLTLYNALDNNVKTLGDVIKQTSAQLEQSGAITPRTLIPILNPDGTPSGVSANPFNPDGPTIRTGVSPDVQSQAQQSELNRAAQAAATAGRQTVALTQQETARRTAEAAAARTDKLTQSQQAVAQIQQDTATRRANADLEIARARSGDVTLQESRQIMEQVAKADTEALKQNGEIAKQAVADLNANERTALMQFVENQKVGEDAREVFQKAIADKNALVASQDEKAYTAQMTQQTARDTATATLAGKLWDNYVKSLDQVYDLPEGFFNAAQRAFQAGAYVKGLPAQLQAQMKHPEADLGKLREFGQAAKAIFDPMQRPDYRPLADIAPEFVREPLPTADLRAASARTGDILSQAQAGTALTPPEMAYNPYAPGFTGTMANPRNVLAPPAPGGFQAPVAQGLEPPPEEQPTPLPFEEPGMNPLDLLNQEAPDLTSDQGMELPDLGEFQAPFDAGTERDVAFYEPILRAAPPELLPAVLNVMAGIAARDDVLDDPERVLREEYDYAFGPFGSQWNLDAPSMDEGLNDNTYDYGLGLDFGQSDYGSDYGDLYA